MSAAAHHLVLHAAIVLLFGLLLGAPYARAIKRGAPAHIVHSWRVAHLSLPLGAILMFAIAALLPGFAIGAAAAWTITLSLIVSAYGFCVSTPLAALTGRRGLAPEAGGWGKLVYVGNMVGSVASLAGAVAILYAAAVSL
jgi:hypothetical protein